MAVTSITVNPDPIQKGRTALFTINLDADAPNARDIGNIRVSTVFSGNSPGTLTRVNNRQWTFTIDITSNELRVRVWVNNVLFIDRFGGGLVDPPPAPTPTITFEGADAQAITQGFAGQLVTAVISLSQALTENLETGDVTVTGGTKSSFSGSGTSYRQSVTLPSRTDGTLTVSIAAGVGQNASGEDNLAAQASLPFSRPRPTITFRQNSGISGVESIADVTFNASVSGIDASNDFRVTNGSFVSITERTVGRAYIVTVRPNSNSDGTLTLAVLENRATRGNHAASATLSFSRQGLSLTFDDAVIVPGIETSLTLTSNAPITGLFAGEIEVTGGGGLGYTVDGNTANLQVTPTRLTDGTLSVRIPENALSHGNRAITASKSYNRPRPTITLDETSVGNSNEVVATIRWDIAPSRSDFATGDITLSAGSKGAFSGSGLEFRQVFTTPASGEGTVVVTVSENAIYEGNPVASASVSYRSVPIPTITFSQENPISGRELDAVVVVSRDITNLVAADFTVTGGTRGNLIRVNARRWLLRVTPNYREDGTLQVSLGADVVPEGNLEATASIAYTRPTFTIESDVSTLHLGDATVVRIACSVPTTFFATGDVTVVNGVKGTFTRVDDSNYTLGVTAPLTGSGDMQITVSADAIPEGNVAVSHTIAYEFIPNAVTITASHTSRYTSQEVTLTYRWENPVTDFDATDITASAGTLLGFTAVSSSEYTQRLTLPVTGEGTVTVAIAENVSETRNAAVSVSIGYTAIPVTLTPGRLALVHDERVQVTVVFGIPVTGLELSEILVVPNNLGIGISNFQGSGDTYTFDVTAPSSGTGQFTLRLPADQTDQGNAAAEVLMSWTPPEEFGFLTTFGKLYLVLEVPFRLITMYKAHSTRRIVDAEVESRWEGATFETEQTGQVIDVIITGTPPRTLGDDFFFVRITLDDGTVEEQDIEYSVVNPTPILDIQPEMTFYRDVEVNALLPIRNNSGGVADGKLLGLFHESMPDGVKVSAMPDKPETNEMIDISVAHPIPGNPRITGQQPYRVVDGTPPLMSEVSHSNGVFSWSAVSGAISYASRVGNDDEEWTDIGNVTSFNLGDRRTARVSFRVNSPWIGAPEEVVFPVTGQSVQVGSQNDFGVGEDNPVGFAIRENGETAFMVGDETNALYTLNLMDGSSERVGLSQNFGRADQFHIIRGISYNESEGVLYGIISYPLSLGGVAVDFCRINTSSGAAIRIAELSIYVVGELAYDNDNGILYAVGDSVISDLGPVRLYTINPSTGEVTRIGDDTSFLDTTIPDGFHHGRCYIEVINGEIWVQSSVKIYRADLTNNELVLETAIDSQGLFFNEGPIAYNVRDSGLYMLTRRNNAHLRRYLRIGE